MSVRPAEVRAEQAGVNGNEAADAGDAAEEEEEGEADGEAAAEDEEADVLADAMGVDDDGEPAEGDEPDLLNEGAARAAPEVSAYGARPVLTDKKGGMSAWRRDTQTLGKRRREHSLVRKHRVSTLNYPNIQAAL